MSLPGDVQHLVNTFTNVLNSDNSVRLAAEADLKKFDSAPGFLPCLVQLLSFPDVPFHIRQSAVVRLKLLCGQCWSGHRAKQLADSDRAAVRSALVNLLCSQPEERIRAQLAECFFVVARTDFPANWPTALDEAIHSLNNAPNPSALYGALLAYNRLCRVFRHAINEADAKIAEELCNRGLPIVLNLLKTAQSQDKTPEVYAIMHLAVKTVAYVTTIRVPSVLRPFPVMDELMQLLLTIVSTETPAETLRELYADKQDKMFEESVFKHKKWALRIILRIFGQTLKARGNKAAIAAQKKWSKDAFIRYSLPTLTMVMGMVSDKSKAQTVPPYVWYQCFKVISYAIPNKTLYSGLIKPQMSGLIGEAILTALRLTSSELDTWKEDPHAFVAQSLNAIIFTQDYRSQAEATLKELIKTRTKTALPITLQVIEGVLHTYSTGIESAQGAAKLDLVLLKDACLRMVGVLRKFFQTKQFSASLQGLLAQHALPEIIAAGQPGAMSPPILAVRALWTVTEYARMEFTDFSILQTVTEFACAALSAPDLTLRVEAGQALGKLLAVPSILQFLRPRAKMLFESVFALMDEFDSENLGVLFRKMLEYFEDDLAPLAYNIVTHIVPKFMALMADSNTDSTDEVDDDAEEKFFTAQQYLASIHTVLIALENSPERIPELETHIVPVVHAILDSQMVDFIDDAMIIVQALTFYPETVVSDAVWSLYPKIIGMVVEGWGADCIECIVSPLSNYISKNIDQFLAGSSNGQSYFDMLMAIPTALYVDRERENSAQCAGQLLRVLCGYAGRRQLDPLYTPILELSANTLLAASNVHLKTVIIDSMAALAYFNPQLFVKALQDVGLLVPAMQVWFTLVPKYKTTTTLYYAILGLSSVIGSVPIEMFPKEMANMMPVMIGKLCESMLLLQELENAEQDEDECDDEEVFQNMDSDVELDDDDDDEEEAFASKLAALSSEARRSVAGDDFGDDFGDDYSALDSDIVTPLDDVNSFEVFLEGIKAWVNRDGAKFPDFTPAITSPESPLAPVFQYATTRKQEFDNALIELAKEDA